MKRFASALTFVLLLSTLAKPQQAMVTNTFVATGTFPPNGVFVANSGVVNHSLTVIPIGTPGTETTVIQGSVIGDFSDASTCVTTSSTSPVTVTCTGIFSKIRINVSTLTGFTSLVATYIGTSTNPSNANTNITQIGGNTVVTGGVNGSLGVGGLAAAGAAPAGNPNLIGSYDGTNVQYDVQHNNHKFLNSPSSGITQIVALASSQSIRISAWGYSQSAGGGTVKLVSGTGANCGSGTADLTETYQNNVLSIAQDGLKGDIIAPSGSAVCVNVSASITGNIWVQYAQF